MPEKDEHNSYKRIDVIQTVKTPMGFFTLIVLVVEIIFGIAARLSQGTDRTYLIIGMIAVIVLLILIVAGLALFRPEALGGNRPPDNSLNFASLSPAERVVRYKELINQETRNNLLLNFNVPEGYIAEVSTIDALAFGFCYPQHWVFSRFPKLIQYGSVSDVQSLTDIGFKRNMNVCIEDISQNQISLKELYESGLQNILSCFSKPKLVSKEENFIFQGLPAMRHTINWIPKTEVNKTLTLYQIQVADKEKRKLYSISFTTLKEDFERSKVIFDNIANTFRI